ncbi:hypothetical protein A2U01_0108166, partial [Trifolium medium]|nr:hypothetical protein [Trifolium medium]
QGWRVAPANGKDSWSFCHLHAAQERMARHAVG